MAEFHSFVSVWNDKSRELRRPALVCKQAADSQMQVRMIGLLKRFSYRRQMDRVCSKMSAQLAQKKWLGRFDPGLLYSIIHKVLERCEKLSEIKRFLCCHSNFSLIAKEA